MGPIKAQVESWSPPSKPTKPRKETCPERDQVLLKNLDNPTPSLILKLGFNIVEKAQRHVRRPQGLDQEVFLHS